MLTDTDADAAARWMADRSRVRVPDAGHPLHRMAAETALRPVTGFLESL